MTLQPGTRLGHYEITSLLGSGGMGEVYRAKDHKLGRDVAIKVLREELASDPERLRRFEQEARSASALNHPNIITIHDIGKHGTTPYIAMEYVEGKTLREVLADGPLPTKKLLQLATQIAEGLAKAHSVGIIHRDLKPENLMVTSDGYVKILDFGLAKLIVRETPSDSESPTATREGTVAGTVMGTVAYMSPEQLRGLPIDARSDMFSLSIVLYEMAAGVHPFQRGSTIDTASAILNEEPTPLSRCAEGIPEPVEQAVNRMLLKDREQRYDSLGEITRHLHQPTLGESVTVKTSRARNTFGKIIERRKQFGLLTLVVSALLSLGVLWIALNVGGTRTRTRIAILPFENLSGVEEEYFSEGITRDVNTEISKIGNLVVVAHGSTRRAQSQGGSYREIAEQLRADYLVDGSVSRSGTRLRITASLIDPENDEQLWANDYDEELSVSHLFTIRGDVAQQVALALNLTLLPSEQPELDSQPTENLEAYQEYLLGRFSWQKRTVEGMEVAIQHYDRAIALDPNFALVHAGLADVHLLLPWFSPKYSNRTGLERAQAAARRALELNPNLGEAYATLGLAQEWQFEWEGAERDFVRAIELNPEYATARHWYANMLARVRRYDDAIEQIRKAQELDPLSPIINQDVGYVLGLAGRREASIRQFKRTLTIDPGFSTTRMVLAWKLLEDGRFEEGRAALERWAELTGNDPELLSQLVLLVRRYAETGESQSVPEALDVAAILPPYSLPRFHMLIGQEEKTLELFERGYLEGAFGMVASVLDPTYDPLRSDPRFQDLLHRMNLPE